MNKKSCEVPVQNLPAEKYQIINTTPDDLDFICWLFEEAIRYQKKNGYTVWNGYDVEAIQKDIGAKEQYKIMIDGSIACIFSVCYTDKIIWRERDQDDAIYIHRIVVNPAFKGQKQFQKVLDWSLDHARQKNRKFIRMDTWQNNPRIILYYQGFGFRFVENYTTPDTPELPVQHRRLSIALLEFSL